MSTSRQKTEPVLQNLPPRTEVARALQKTFTPQLGTAWTLSCDYSQLELRVLSQLGKP